MVIFQESTQWTASGIPAHLAGSIPVLSDSGGASIVDQHLLFEHDQIVYSWHWFLHDYVDTIIFICFFFFFFFFFFIIAREMERGETTGETVRGMALLQRQWNYGRQFPAIIRNDPLRATVRFARGGLENHPQSHYHQSHVNPTHKLTFYNLNTNILTHFDLVNQNFDISSTILTHFDNFWLQKENFDLRKANFDLKTKLLSHFDQLFTNFDLRKANFDLRTKILTLLAQFWHFLIYENQNFDTFWSLESNILTIFDFKRKILILGKQILTLKPKFCHIRANFLPILISGKQTLTLEPKFWHY